MELIEDSKNRKVYEEDGTTYTMLDMGSYVGHRTRPWYQTPAPKWFLMSMQDVSDKDVTRVETLVDEFGLYMRFIIDKGPIRRVILLQSGLVFSDTIVVMNGEGFGPRYAALDGDAYSETRYPLGTYLSSPKPFDLRGKTLPGEIPSLDILTKYLSANNKLQNEIMNGPEAKL